MAQNPAPEPTNAVVKNLLTQACRHCGGTEHSHVPNLDVVFEKLDANAKGSRSYRFEIVVCRSCMCVDWFVPLGAQGHHLKMLEQNPHRIYRAPPTPPYR